MQLFICRVSSFNPSTSLCLSFDVYQWFDTFLHLLIILSDGVVAESLLIEPMMNIIIDYLKNVTQGVGMILTKIDGENKGKI